MAMAVPLLIRFLLVPSFIGLCDYMLSLDTIISITIVSIYCSGSFFLHGMLAPYLTLQSPHRTLVSWLISFSMQMFRRPNFGDHSLSHARK
jgi:hypothetical protein